MMRTDDDLMVRALTLATRSEGRVEPNPMVGAVVTDAAGQVCGEGFHEVYGGPHAEIVALRHAGHRARGGTVVVTLEPCRHFGKTPPCTRALLAAGVRRVVVAARDPNPLVNGGGIAELRAAGVEVVENVRAVEARQLLGPFAKRVRSGMPWVIAKWAMTLDGKTATRTGDSKWISGEESRAEVHKLRGRVDAILVGAGTVRADDPLLTARPQGPRVALRVVLSRRGDLPAECQLTRTAQEVPVLVLTEPAGEASLTAWRAAGCEILSFADLTPTVVLRELGRRNMTNVLLESGSAVAGSFADAGCIDEVWAFIAPKLAGGGPSPLDGHGVEFMRNADGWAMTMEMRGVDAWLRARRENRYTERDSLT